MKADKKRIMGVVLCGVVLVQAAQIFRLSRMAADAEWRLENMQLCRALLDVRDAAGVARVSDVRIEYVPHPKLGVNRDDMMVVSPNPDGTRSVVWVGSGLPVKAKAISGTYGSVDFELQPGVANLVSFAGTNQPMLQFPQAGP